MKLNICRIPNCLLAEHTLILFNEHSFIWICFKYFPWKFHPLSLKVLIVILWHIVRAVDDSLSHWRYKMSFFLPAEGTALKRIIVWNCRRLWPGLGALPSLLTQNPSLHGTGTAKRVTGRPRPRFDFTPDQVRHSGLAANHTHAPVLPTEKWPLFTPLSPRLACLNDFLSEDARGEKPGQRPSTCASSKKGEKEASQTIQSDTVLNVHQRKQYTQSMKSWKNGAQNIHILKRQLKTVYIPVIKCLFKTWMYCAQFLHEFIDCVYCCLWYINILSIYQKIWQKMNK